MRKKLVFDSDLDRRIIGNSHLNSVAHYFLNAPERKTPETIMQSFAIIADDREIIRVTENHQRVVWIKMPFKAKRIEFRPLDPEAKKVFAFEVR